jgi:hypothetical protein
MVRLIIIMVAALATAAVVLRVAYILIFFIPNIFELMLANSNS